MFNRSRIKKLENLEKPERKQLLAWQKNDGTVKYEGTIYPDLDTFYEQMSKLGYEKEDILIITYIIDIDR